MTEREDPDRLADELDGQADEMEQRSGGLQDEIQDVREDWQRKRSDESVPGATPPREDSDRDEPGDEVNPEDAGRAATESPNAGRAQDDEQHRDEDEDRESDEDEDREDEG
ncbi:MAG: hypothetical protein WAL63_10300 [Solirubrobacteraceae bacterium]